MASPSSNSLPHSVNVEDSAGKFSRDERLYSAREVAERLGVSERWVRDHATRRNPRIPAVKLGPLLRFRWRDIERFVATQMTHFPRRIRGNV
jgi:excisionase family DNA binding protein